ADLSARSGTGRGSATARPWASGTGSARDLSAGGRAHLSGGGPGGAARSVHTGSTAAAWRLGGTPWCRCAACAGDRGMGGEAGVGRSGGHHTFRQRYVASGASYRAGPGEGHQRRTPAVGEDRKSTRLNSSHVSRSYAV